MSISGDNTPRQYNTKAITGGSVQKAEELKINVDNKNNENNKHNSLSLLVKSEILAIQTELNLYR